MPAQCFEAVPPCRNVVHHGTHANTQKAYEPPMSKFFCALRAEVAALAVGDRAAENHTEMLGQ